MMRRRWWRGGLGLAVGGWVMTTLAARGVAEDANPTAAERIVALHFEARGEDPTALPPARDRRGTEEEGRTETGLRWRILPDVGVRVDRTWTLLGRAHHRAAGVHSEDGWQQEVAPEARRPTPLGATETARLRWEGWILADPVAPLRPAFGAELTFLSERSLRGRAALWVRVEPPKGPPAVYVFDRESFLLLAVQMPWTFAGQEVPVLAVATGVAREGTALLETGFDFYVGDERFRRVRFETTTAAPALLPALFIEPAFPERWLRSGGATPAAP